MEGVPREKWVKLTFPLGEDCRDVMSVVKSQTPSTLMGGDGTGITKKCLKIQGKLCINGCIFKNHA